MDTKKEWLAARRTGIGASEIGILLGLSPYSSPLEVWARKLEMLPEIEDSPYMETGRVLEAAIRDWYLGTRSATLGTAPAHAIAIHSGPSGTTYRHPEHPWMLATPDAIAIDFEGPLVVEVKFSSRTWDDDAPPAHYVAQVQQQLAVLGLPRGAIAGCIAGRMLAWDVPRDDAMISRIVEVGAAFWRLVESRTEPPITGADKAAIAAMHPEISGEELSSDDLDLAMLDDTIEHHTREEKRLAAEREECEAKIRAAIGDAKRLTLATGATWTRTAIAESTYTATRKASIRYTRKSPRGR